MSVVCTAYDLRDGSLKCDQPASKGKLFCPLHSRQAQLLYAGYKRRTDELIKSAQDPPIPLPRNAEQSTFSEINSVEDGRKLHSWLMKRYNLTTRCILARELHHSRFFHDTSDYGHAAFLDKLKSARSSIEKQLARLDMRITELQLGEEKIVEWIRQQQKEDDTRSAAEKKKVKSENALFKRYQARINCIREPEREAEQEAAEKDAWDPVEMYIREYRGGYIALLRVLLLTERLEEEQVALAKQRALEMKMAGFDVELDSMMVPEDTSAKVHSANGNEINFFSQVNIYHDGEGRDLLTRGTSSDDSIKLLIDNLRETCEDEPELEAVFESIRKLRSVHKPTKEEAMVDQDAIREIRECLFLRFVLRSPSLVVAALDCDSIEGFLSDDRVRNSDLRDLALIIATPSLQDVRDACSDYWIGKTGVKDAIQPGKRAAIVSKNKELCECCKGCGEHKIDIKDFVVLRLCDRWLYYYNDQGEMTRRGWVQFGLITKCDFSAAISTCHTFQEFYELSTLSLNGYFRDTTLPPSWSAVEDSPLLQHMRRVGFMPFAFSSDHPRELALRMTQPGPSAKGGKKGRKNVTANVPKNPSIQIRHYICGVLPSGEATFRFISMVNSYTTELCMAVKALDTELDTIKLCEAPQNERWFCRESMARGSTMGKWKVREEYGPKFEAAINSARGNCFNFKDRIEVTLWDRHENRSCYELHLVVVKLLNKAFRVRDHLASLEATFKIYQNFSDFEHGPKSNRAKAVRDIYMQLQEYRSSNGFQKLKGGWETLFYDQIDESIDRLNLWPTVVKALEFFFGCQRYYEDLLSREHSSPVQRYEQERSRLLEYMSSLYNGPYKSPDRILSEILLIKPDNLKIESTTAEFKRRALVWMWKGINTTLPDLLTELQLFAASQEDDQAVKHPKQYETYRRILEHTEAPIDGDQTSTSEQQQMASQREKLAFDRKVLKVSRFKIYINQMHRLFWGEMDQRLDEPFNIQGRKPITDFMWPKSIRAQNPPLRRPSVITDAVKEQWKCILEKRARRKLGQHYGELQFSPEETSYIQIVLMKLWLKEGAIQPTWQRGWETGDAVACYAAREPTKLSQLGFYIDYASKKIAQTFSGNVKPSKPAGGQRYLRNELEKWEKEFPGSTYSLLRIWSGEEFWPFAHLEEEGRSKTTFIDPTGRQWECLKTPKDMPNSDIKCHSGLTHMLTNFPRSGDETIDRLPERCRWWMDQVLVRLYVKQDDKSRICSEMIASYLRKPHIDVDIDFARSFLGVDAAFLRDLSEWWWEAG